MRRLMYYLEALPQSYAQFGRPRPDIPQYRVLYRQYSHHQSQEPIFKDNNLYQVSYWKEKSMAAVVDEALERRRIQNRMAQRRFRQRRQDHRKPTKSLQIDPQAAQQNASQPGSADMANFDNHFEDFLLESDELPISPSHSPKASNSISSNQFEHFALLDHVNFEDLSRSFTAHAAITATTTEQYVQPVTSPTSIEPNDLLGSSIAAIGVNCDALSHRPEKMRRLSREQVVGETTRAGPTITDLVEFSAFNSASASNTSTTTESPSTGQGTSPRSAGSTSGWVSALHIAAQKGHSGIVRVLLQQNADSNERDSDGLTPLMHAALGGHDEVAGILLAHGANLSDLDRHRRSALHWAVLAQRENLLRLLLEHAVKRPFLIDGYDDTGHTPLHTAVDSGFEPGVAVLLKYGANLHSRARKS